MKDKTEKIPWYFISAIVPYIISPIIDDVVASYIGEEEVDTFLSRSISLKILLPFISCIIIVIICMCIYIIQCRKKIKEQVTSEDLSVIQNTLEKYMDDYEYIESIQAYQYWSKGDSRSKYVKICYLTGVADERIDINSIMQSYYYFPYSVHKKIKKVSGLYDKFIQTEEPNEKLEYKNSFIRLGTELCETILNSLKNIKSADEIQEFHCEMYRALLRILSAISGKPINKVLENEEVENALITSKKCGILGSVILRDLYIFRNRSSVSKMDRIYFTFPYDKKRRIVLLASMNKSCFHANSDDDIANYCEAVVSGIKKKEPRV